MPIGILFWVLMVIWFIGAAWVSWPLGVGFGINMLLFGVIALLGWKTFGPVLQ